MKTFIIFIFSLLLGLGNARAQFVKDLGKKARKASERAVERRVEREATQKTDAALDKALNGSKSEKQAGSAGEGQPTRSKPAAEEASGRNTARETDGDRAANARPKSDFEPGNRVLVSENFEQDAIGDFPAHWNTDASAKVVTLPGSPAKWLELSTPGTFLLETAKQLPEHFTLEFDVFVPASFSYYDHPLWIGLADMQNRKEFFIWGKYREKRGKDKRNGLLLMLHPQEEGGKKLGYSEYEVWEKGEKSAFNRIKSLTAFNVNNNRARVQIWRQKQRIRVYVNDIKIWDLPRALEADKTLNTLLFSRYEAKEGNHFHISNIRLASSEEDARSRILKEGRYSTNAILFNTGSAAIRPESTPVIKEIAGILKDTPALKLKIIGHTDTDGKKESNLLLSRERAAAVKNELVQKYGIADGRLQTDGKGDTEPVADNTTPEGKTRNRRVEFIKIQ